MAHSDQQPVARSAPLALPFHYAWIVVGVTFLVLLTAAGVRTAPAVLITPLQLEFGWSRGSISLAVAISIIWFGLGGPVAGTLVDRFGPRRVMLGGLGMIALGLGPLLLLREIWQLHLFWGLVVGVGTGAVANVLAATVAHRWFRTRRGLVVGLLSGGSAAGQLIFLPAMMGLTTSGGWRLAVIGAALAVLALLLPVALLMRDAPADVGLRPLGDDGSPAHAAEAAAPQARTSLAEALRTRDFWLLAGSFFICGYTTNGLIGTHLLPHAIDSGFSEVVAASAIGVMGMMNIVGTLASGWLSDRFDNRLLLGTYYGLRAISIAGLPFISGMGGFLIFAVIYGLDWIATVPPTVNLTAQRFGKGSLGQLYGWIFFSHMVGAAIAAYAGGALRDLLGDYTVAFLSAALLGFIAAAFSAGISKVRAAQPA